MRIAICDDEEAQRKLVEKYLYEWADGKKLMLDILHFADAESFLFNWEDDKSFDLLVLDIEMNNISGMQLAMQLREAGHEVPVLFITGYDSYMAQGYEVSALHYLLKPVHKEKLFMVLDRLKNTKKEAKKIFFQTEEGNISVDVEDIWYIEAAGHQCVLKAAKGIYRLKSSISEVKAALTAENCFIACHRSYIVNIRKISAIIKSDIIMDDGTKLPVSRSLLKQVNEAFIRNYRN